VAPVADCCCCCCTTVVDWCCIVGFDNKKVVIVAFLMAVSKKYKCWLKIVSRVMCVRERSETQRKIFKRVNEKCEMVLLCGKGDDDVVKLKKDVEIAWCGGGKILRKTNWQFAAAAACDD